MNCTNHICDTNPCLNGRCVRTPTGTGHKCVCDDGFSGLKCEQDACSPNPCDNKGDCNHIPNGGFDCDCKPGEFVLSNLVAQDPSTLT